MLCVTYLKNNAHKNDNVCTEDIGYIGYHIKNKVIDRVGLVSEEVVAYNKIGAWGDFILDTRPRWLIISPSDPTAGILEDEFFNKIYDKKEFFSYPGLTEWEFEIYEYMIKTIRDYMN